MYPPNYQTFNQLLELVEANDVYFPDFKFAMEIHVSKIEVALFESQLPSRSNLVAEVNRGNEIISLEAFKQRL